MRCCKAKSLFPQTGGSKPPPYVKGNGRQMKCPLQKLVLLWSGRTQCAPTKIVRRARSFEVMPKASLLLTARTGARSAPLRGLAVFYSYSVAINQSKRLRAKGNLSEAPSEEGAPPQAVREFPFQTQSYFPVNADAHSAPLRW